MQPLYCIIALMMTQYNYGACNTYTDVIFLRLNEMLDYLFLSFHSNTVSCFVCMSFVNRQAGPPQQTTAWHTACYTTDNETKF